MLRRIVAMVFDKEEDADEILEAAFIIEQEFDSHMKKHLHHVDKVAQCKKAHRNWRKLK